MCFSEISVCDILFRTSRTIFADPYCSPCFFLCYRKQLASACLAACSSICLKNFLFLSFECIKCLFPLCLLVVSPCMGLSCAMSFLLLCFFFQWVVEFCQKEPFKNIPQLWGKTKHWTVSSMLFIDSQKFIMAMVHVASSLPLSWNSVGSLQANYFDKQNCSSFKAHKNFDLRDSREYWHKWYFLIGQLELLISIC